MLCVKQLHGSHEIPLEVMTAALDFLKRIGYNCGMLCVVVIAHLRIFNAEIKSKIKLKP